MTQPDEKTLFDRRWPSLSTLILLGLVLGVLCGLFFGEACARLEIVGRAFVDLLQMTVLPYVIVAIVLQLGRLNWSELRRLAVAGGGVLAVLWITGALVVCLFPQALPSWKAGAFFSASEIEQPESVSLLDQIITPNPFHALADGMIPAVVLFSMMIGLALTGIPQKQQVLSLLQSADRMLRTLTGAIVKLTPIGVFAIAASAAGTLRIDELSRLQGYLLLQVLTTLILLFWLIPWLISLCTPLSYRDVAAGSRGVLITAFATGKVLVVIPMVIEASQQLLQRHSIGDESTTDTVEAIVPLAYPFPHLGRILGLLFVPFAAWFVGRPMQPADYPPFLATGYLTMFGSSVVGIPWLLDAQRLPADMFQLFLASGVICGRLADAVGAMHLFAMAVATPTLLCGQARFKPIKLILFATASAMLVVATMIGTRIYLASTLGDLQKQSDVLAQMHTALASPSRPATVRRTAPDSAAAGATFPSRVDRIRETDTLRVGYHPANLPFSFFNASDELVGFDVDMAHLLADDLGVALEFVPFEFNTLHEQLDRGDFDVAMSGIAVTPTRLLRMSFSEPYFNATLAFVVKDHLREKFSTSESARQLSGVRVAVPRSGFFAAQLEIYMPHAEVVPIDSPREFFEKGEYDAMLASAEAGSAWTIQYPDYAVAIPQPDVHSHPLSYAVPQGDSWMVELMDRWIEINKGQPIYQQLYDHWISGKAAGPRQPRWCIIRDVLHWVE